MKTITLTLLTFVFLSSCQNKPSQKPKDIRYEQAQNYFVKNTVDSLSQPRITTRVDFEKIFGPATTMGAEGKPTPINFAKQAVIALVLPETQSAITLTPQSLQQQGDQLILSYKKETGAQQSFTTRPYLILIIDKNITGEVRFIAE